MMRMTTTIIIIIKSLVARCRGDFGCDVYHTQMTSGSLVASCRGVLGCTCRPTENGCSPLPTFSRCVISPLYISERGGPGWRSPPGEKMGVRGAESSGFVLILRIRNNNAEIP